MSNIRITAPFDGGNIECLSADDASDIRLNIRKDAGGVYSQWFYFRASGVAGKACTFRLMNAGEASYTQAWPGYRAVASYDMQHWFRIDTAYNDGVLDMSLTPSGNAVYLAFFAPYPVERYRAFIAGISQRSGVTASTIGTTLDGEPLELLRLGTDHKNAPAFWTIARQHAGETMASWWMEGFLERLTARTPDRVVQRLLERVRLHVIPLVNIDGSRRGHLRGNAIGTDLNREWAEPSMEKSPEVVHILREMDAAGCDLFLDVHGDETIPNNFIAGAEGIPGWDERQKERLDEFKSTLAQIDPAFQTKDGYPLTPAGKANLKVATNAIAHRFDCLAGTLEMPFKDADVAPTPETGWSPERCRELGRSCVEAMEKMLDRL